MIEEIDHTGDFGYDGVDLGEAELDGIEATDVEYADTVGELPGAEVPDEAPPAELAADSASEQELAAASAAAPIPDPFGGQDSAPGDVTFGSASASGKDVEFEDGTTVTSPKQDALGYVYKDNESYLQGTDKHELSSGGDSATSA